MLLLMAAQIIIGFVLNFNEGAQAFREGWEQGSNADASAPFDFLDGFLVPVLGFVCIFLLIRAFIAFVRFILNINRDKVFVKENIPSLHIVPSQATYLLWLDCSPFTNDSVALAEEIRRKTGLFLSNGTQYGETGKKFLRMNIACPRTLLLDGLNRLASALNS